MKYDENNWEQEQEDILSDDSLDCLKRITDVLSLSKIFDHILSPFFLNMFDPQLSAGGSFAAAFFHSGCDSGSF